MAIKAEDNEERVKGAWSELAEMARKIRRKSEMCGASLKTRALGGKWVGEAYENAECPDCGEEIPTYMVEGDNCSNCEHVFWNIKQGEDNGNV